MKEGESMSYATIPIYTPTQSVSNDYNAISTIGNIGWNDSVINTSHYYAPSVLANDVRIVFFDTSIASILASDYGYPTPVPSNPYYIVGMGLCNRPFTLTMPNKRNENGVISYYTESANSGVIRVGGIDYNAMRFIFRHASTTAVAEFYGIYSGITLYTDVIQAVRDSGIYGLTYPITYSLTNCTATSAPSEAAGGSDIVVNITPSQGYILRSSGVSIVDSNGVSVPYIVQGNQIAFTMPYAP